MSSPMIGNRFVALTERVSLLSRLLNEQKNNIRFLSRGDGFATWSLPQPRV